MTLTEKNDIAERLGGEVRRAGVLLSWETAQELLDLSQEYTHLLEELQRRGILDAAGDLVLPSGNTVSLRSVDRRGLSPLPARH